MPLYERRVRMRASLIWIVFLSALIALDVAILADSFVNLLDWATLIAIIFLSICVGIWVRTYWEGE